MIFQLVSYSARVFMTNSKNLPQAALYAVFFFQTMKASFLHSLKNSLTSSYCYSQSAVVLCPAHLEMHAGLKKKNTGELSHIFMIVRPSVLPKKIKQKQEGKRGEPVSIFPDWKHLWVEFVSLSPLKYF